MFSVFEVRSVHINFGTRLSAVMIVNVSIKNLWEEVRVLGVALNESGVFFLIINHLPKKQHIEVEFYTL
jgi:hypothetical protein